MPQTLQKTETPLDGVTATTTSQKIDLRGVRKATWFFTRADHDSGDTEFTVDVYADADTSVTYAKLMTNAAATNSQTQVKVASVTLSSDTTESYTMDLAQDAYQYMTVTATETDDGTHTAKVVLEYY